MTELEDCQVINSVLITEHGYKNILVAACISEVNLPLKVHHLVHQKTCRGILQFQYDAQIFAE